MPRARLLVIERAFLVLGARIGQWRENILTVLPLPSFYLSFSLFLSLSLSHFVSQLALPCKYSTCASAALHELREARRE